MFSITTVPGPVLPDLVRGGPAIYAMRGLPGCGKSTARDALISAAAAAGIDDVVVVSRDDVRLELGDVSQRPATEKKVTRLCAERTDEALSRGAVLISDNTNLSPAAVGALEAAARRFDCPLVWIDFTHVTVADCIKRDAARHTGRVGELVIRRMWRTHLAPRDPGPTPPPGSPTVVIFDVDGTLARMGRRSPYDWQRVGEDSPVEEIVELARLEHAAGYPVKVVSGRDGSCYDLTRDWLAEHLGIPFELHMRPAGDTRSDEVVKEEIYREHFAGKVVVRRVYDDRRRVVDTWRYQLGLVCLQVADLDH